MKIIKFKDGTYGIKRGWWIFSEYYDMSGWYHNWWCTDEYIHKNAKTDDLSRCESIYEKLINHKEPTNDFEVIDH